MNLEIREIDREESWTAEPGYYVRRIVITERIPIDDVPTCRWCGDPMFGKRADAKYCSTACRHAAYRRRHSHSARAEPLGARG